MDTPKKRPKVRTYAIDIDLPGHSVEELIQALYAIGNVETLRFTVVAPDHQSAVEDTLDVLNDFSINHGAGELSEEQRENVVDGLHRIRHDSLKL